MGRFIELISHEEAIGRIRSINWKLPGTELIAPDQSAGRIASADVTAKNDVPSWNRSLVDGYAVRSSDCAGASETNPVVFQINGIVEAGSSTYEGFAEGQCTVIYTGGVLPEDYDAVVMAEDAELTGTAVKVFNHLKPWENVERKGDDLRAGSNILKKSEFVRPWHISAMLSAGVNSLQVFEKLKIGVIATGNELFEGSEGFIPNTTQKIYVDYLNRKFMNAEAAGIAHDRVEEIRNLIDKSLENYHCVIVTGGTSLGGKDEVPEAMSGMGNVVFAGSMLRPGRTLTLYEVHGKPVFSVSGIPVPSLLSLDVYFEEYLRRITGLETYRQKVTGILDSPVTNRAGYTTIFRVKYTANTGGGAVEIVKTKGTGSLGSVLNSNGTLEVHGDVEGYPSGSTVVVKLFGDAL